MPGVAARVAFAPAPAPWTERRRAAARLGFAVARRLYPTAVPVRRGDGPCDLILLDGLAVEAKAASSRGVVHFTPGQVEAFRAGRARVVLTVYNARALNGVADLRHLAWAAVVVADVPGEFVLEFLRDRDVDTVEAWAVATAAVREGVVRVVPRLDVRYGRERAILSFVPVATVGDAPGQDLRVYRARTGRQSGAAVPF